MRVNRPGLLFLGIICSLLLTLAIYWPGLTGYFLLDSVLSLEPLGDIPDDISTIPALLQFVFSGDTGPTGRPLALLSFLINDTAWPTSAFTFKYTNLLLHLLNGILVFWLIQRLLTLIQHEYPLAIAMLTCLIWLVHPLQVSSVLYVIQRMAELSTLFTLAALITWLYGRDAISRGNRPATWCTALFIIFFGLLALLSKENGALIPLYILALEIPLNSGANRSTSLNKWLGYFILIPALSLVAYLIHYSLTTTAWGWRPFSLTERLLSEAHVLSHYLLQIVLPRMSGTGLFHDDFPISTSLLNPVQTLPAVLFIIVLIISAWTLRRRWPLYSFAITWFFAGHLMESSILPLELYFEHRNYLPMMAILLALVAGTVTLASKSRIPALLLLTIYTLTCIFQTYQHTTLWGKPLESAMVWATENPASIRAQYHAMAIINHYLPNPENEAIKIWKQEKQGIIAQRITKYHSGDLRNHLTQLVFTCSDGIDRTTVNKTIRLLESEKLHPANTSIIKKLAETVQTGDRCNNSLTQSDILDFVHAMENNHTMPNFYALYNIRGYIAAGRGDLDSAIHYLNLAYEHKPLPYFRLLQIAFLYSAGLYSDAAEYLDKLALEASWLDTYLYKEYMDNWHRLIGNAQQHAIKNES